MLQRTWNGFDYISEYIYRIVVEKINLKSFILGSEPGRALGRDRVAETRLTCAEGSKVPRMEWQNKSITRHAHNTRNTVKEIVEADGI